MMFIKENGRWFIRVHNWLVPYVGNMWIAVNPFHRR